MQVKRLKARLVHIEQQSDQKTENVRSHEGNLFLLGHVIVWETYTTTKTKHFITKQVGVG
jgi:hypothetical protein